MNEPDKPIDKVTTNLLDAALRAVGIQISEHLLDRIIDVVELIEDKGEQVSLKDLSELQELWNQ